MRRPLTHIASQIFDSPLAIVPEKLEIILHAVGPRINLDEAAMAELASSGVFRSVDGAGRPLTRPLISWDDDEDSEDDHSVSSKEKPYTITKAGVACIPISGTLMKNGSWMSALSGCASYRNIEGSVQAAMKDSAVKAVLFDINSPGGVTHGCFELTDQLYSLRGDKPFYAIANDMACSAAYALGSTADKLFVTRTGAVGSIGVFCCHLDRSKADSMSGLKYRFVHFGEHKVEGNEHQPLSSDAEARMQAEIDRQGEMFVATVARNRGVTKARVLGTKAGVEYGDNAVGLLADAVGTYQDALAELTKKVTKDSRKGSGSREASAESSPILTDELDSDPKLRHNVSEDTDTVLTEGVAMKEPDKDEKDEKDSKSKKSAASKKVDPEANEDCEAAAEKDEDDEDDEEEEPEPKKKGGKAKKASASASIYDSTAAATEIAFLCQISGHADKTADFLLDGKTVAEVKVLLRDLRASASTGQQSVGSTFGATSNDISTKLVNQARSLMANSGNQLTLAKAMERVMVANPQMYQELEEQREMAMQTSASRREYMQAMTPQLASLGLSIMR